jgi:hypothetical protein
LYLAHLSAAFDPLQEVSMSGFAILPCRRIGRPSSAGASVSDVAAADVVSIGGDLDASSQERCFDADVAATSTNMHVDLAVTTFMDCRGYAALIAARQVIEGVGGELTWRGATGGPAGPL